MGHKWWDFRPKPGRLLAEGGCFQLCCKNIGPLTHFWKSCYALDKTAMQGRVVTFLRIYVALWGWALHLSPGLAGFQKAVVRKPETSVVGWGSWYHEEGKPTCFVALLSLCHCFGLNTFSPLMFFFFLNYKNNAATALYKI